jgi:2-hydroxymuconate-semialdehyde hydrolase
MEKIKENTISIDGHTISYKEAGKGSAILLIHGIPTSSDLWRKVMPEMSKHNRVIAPDLLNYGKSEKPEKANVSIKAQSELLIKLLDELKIEAADVVGHDIGGGIAQLMAVNHPERVKKMVLIDSVCFDSWPIPEFKPLQEEDAEERTSVEELQQQMAQLMPKGVYNKEAMTDELKERYLQVWNSEEGKHAFFRNINYLDPKYTMTIAKDLEDLPHETLILWGRDDEFQKKSYASMLKETIPHAELVFIKEAGHWLMEERPKEVSQHLVAFINREEQMRKAA